jgi:4-amino-4-deoxy-L-arabinose transferase-like glycosyltransferase
MSDRWHYLCWTALWLVLVASSLLSRPLVPLDETRYAGVAWEMWARGDLLVPHLNGEPYSHKAPLLFWLVHAGWLVFGVNDWWPRLMPALFALAAVFLTAHLARRLWPGRPEVARMAPALLLGASAWMMFTPMLMFDLILVCWVLAALAGLLHAAQSGHNSGWAVFTLATALGILTKGPVMLLHALVPALLMPHLLPAGHGVRIRGWYGRLSVATIAAALLVLLWAVPAALRGGEDYARAIFWGQTSRRMVDSFAHKAPWWWYLAYLPVLLFPWLYWPRLWAAVRRQWQGEQDRAAVFCAAWFAAILLAFSLISGKRLHYLLPVLPVLALLAARALSALRPWPVLRLDAWPISLSLMLLALVFAFAPGMQPRYHWPEWIAHLPPALGAVLLAAAVAAAAWSRRFSAEGRVLHLSAVMTVAFSLVQASLASAALPYYDLRPVSRYLQERKETGVPLAYLGKYHDQFQFYGRLTHPLTVLTERDAPAWAEGHPEGLLIAYYDEDVPEVPVQPLIRSPHRGGWLTVWQGREVAAYPVVARLN